MMGDQRRTDTKMFLYGVDLERRVRKHHRLRKVVERIDFSFVRARVKELYGRNGNISEDPIVIVKLLFLLFFENVKSERELMRQVPERIDWMWFLGFGLEDPIPHHSILSKARARWGRDVFEELFVRVLKACIKADLVDGRKIHMDGSLVDANASIKSIKAGPEALIENLKGIYRGEEKKLTSQSTGTQRRTLSRTDPDAAVVGRRKQSGSSRPRYKNHRVVDDRQGVITAIETTPADVTEDSRLIDLVEQHERNTEQQVASIAADSQYGTNDNFAECAERGIEAHMADLRESQRSVVFSQEAFIYEPETDGYVCPAGERLHRIQDDAQWQVYQISGRICNACALKQSCTKSDNGRKLKRHKRHELIVKAREQSHSLQGKMARRRRRHLMEGSFADGANNHHFKRSRWRRLWRQQIQDLLIATCQNIRLLIDSRVLKLAYEAAQPTFCGFACTRHFSHV